MKIDLDKLWTIAQVGEHMGTNARAVYRALKRAREDGQPELCVSVLNRVLIPVENIPTIQKYYYPYYSEAHQANVKQWGARGGSTKKANQDLREHDADCGNAGERAAN